MNMERMLYDMLAYSAPIILCVLGGNFGHRANVLNIALEGMLLTGAFSSVLFTLLTKNMFLGIFISCLITLLMGLVFSYMSVTKKGNPIIAGLAINLFASSGTAFILKAIKMPNVNANSLIDVAALKIQLPIISDIPFVGGVVSGHPLLTYVSFIGIAVMWVIMYRTKFGVYVRVVGENEDAAISVGIRTNRIKYIAIMIGSVCCALAGANMALEKMALFTNNMSAGIGFIAIAAIFCGRGQPVRTSLYAMMFGLMQAMAINLNISAGPASGLLNTLPYFMIIIILAVVSALKLKNNHIRSFKAE